MIVVMIKGIAGGKVARSFKHYKHCELPWWQLELYIICVCTNNVFTVKGDSNLQGRPRWLSCSLRSSTRHPPLPESPSKCMPGFSCSAGQTLDSKTFAPPLILDLPLLLSRRVTDAFGFDYASFRLRRPVPCPAGTYCHPGSASDDLGMHNFTMPQPCLEVIYSTKCSFYFPVRNTKMVEEHAVGPVLRQICCEYAKVHYTLVLLLLLERC